MQCVTAIRQSRQSILVAAKTQPLCACGASSSPVSYRHGGHPAQTRKPPGMGLSTAFSTGNSDHPRPLSVSVPAVTSYCYQLRNCS
jgi:hypothetical protein